MRVELTLESTPKAPAEARRALAPLGHEIAYDRLVDVQTVVSELVTNGVKFGPGRPIDVRVWIEEGDGVRGEVHDHGRGDVRARSLADPAAGEGGLGLRIVDRITEDWGTGLGRSDVWFRVAI
jgi:anti-sigma regulatory factor (Ser/Thr protein kinase)